MPNVMNIVHDVLPFIKKYTACNNWTDQQLVRLLHQSVDAGHFLFTQHRGQMIGIAFAEVNERTKTVFALGFTIHPDFRVLLKTYLQKFKDKYPGYRLLGMRHGKEKEIDYERILQKLS